MNRCDPTVRAKCPDGKRCELYAEFADGSECDKFNEQVLSRPMSDMTTDPEMRLVSQFRNEAMAEFIRLCKGNDFNKLTLLTIGDSIDRLHEKFSAIPTVDVVKWIPVMERLPDTIPCGAGTAYSEAVNVLTTGRKVLTAIWDGTDFIADAEFWEAEREEITHWVPIPLPLPKPPKEV